MISIHEFKRLADSLDYKQFKRVLKFTSEFSGGEHHLVMKLRASVDHDAEDVTLLSGWCDYTAVADQFNTLFALQPEREHSYRVHAFVGDCDMWDWEVRNTHGALISKCTEGHLTKEQAEAEAAQEVKHLIAQLEGVK